MGELSPLENSSLCKAAMASYLFNVKKSFACAYCQVLNSNKILRNNLKEKKKFTVDKSLWLLNTYYHSLSLITNSLYRILFQFFSMLFFHSVCLIFLSSKLLSFSLLLFSYHPSLFSVSMFLNNLFPKG